MPSHGNVGFFKVGFTVTSASQLGAYASWELKFFEQSSSEGRQCLRRILRVAQVQLGFDVGCTKSIPILHGPLFSNLKEFFIYSCVNELSW